MVRTWVSGGESSESIDKLKDELSELEKKRSELMEWNKAKIFDWAAKAIKSLGTDDNLSAEVKEILAEYDSLAQTIFDKEVLLSERLDAQAKFDSLG
jgi:hypothetical protein